MENKTINTYEQQAQKIFNALSDAQKNYIFELHEGAYDYTTSQKYRDKDANKLYGVMDYLAVGYAAGVGSALDTLIFSYCTNRHHTENE